MRKWAVRANYHGPVWIQDTCMKAELSEDCLVLGKAKNLDPVRIWDSCGACQPIWCLSRGRTLAGQESYAVTFKRRYSLPVRRHSRSSDRLGTGSGKEIFLYSEHPDIYWR